MFKQLLLAALVGLALSAPSSKVQSSLSQILASNGVADIVVTFTKETDAVLRNVNSLKFATRGAKITTMMAQLETLRESSQSNVVQKLVALGVPHTSLWVNNRMYISGADQSIVDVIAAFPEVAGVRKAHVVLVDQPIYESNQTVNAEWGVELIEAPAAWSMPGGNNGVGVVVSNVDTGVLYTHEALNANYRSSYGWFDPYNGNANPMDGNGHGTHTMGTIAGSGGIGVAPGAQWIACRGCSTSSCTEAALNACGQWITCPTLANGGSPDCNQAPNLVSNSWGGGAGDNWYNPVINAWHAAGIVPLFSAGNSGPSCGSANSPGDNADVIGVGSTTSSDDISSFSSRGPSQFGTVKPDISAPGSNVRSAWNTGNTAYNTISGTSMACPHVAGATALLLSQNSNLSYEQVKTLLYDNTDRTLGSATTCGGTPPTQFPNNIYGYGRVNCRKSLTAAIGGL